eukprot:gene19342-21260_t
MLRKEAREIEMMLGTKKTVLEVYAAELKSIDGDFSMTTEITKLDKPVITEVRNPDFVGILGIYAHLKGVNIADMINMFKDGGFQLHKWHSNAAELEDCTSSDEVQTVADESLGARSTETSILGLKWNKNQDLISVNFLPAKETAETTKRGILRGMARVFDPLGIASPVLLKAKKLYRQPCEDNLPWDKQLPESLAKQWGKWQMQLPESISPSTESSEEAKLIKEVMMKIIEKPKEDTLWTLMEKYSYWKTIRVKAWVNRFFLNYRQGK